MALPTARRLPTWTDQLAQHDGMQLDVGILTSMRRDVRLARPLGELPSIPTGFPSPRSRCAGTM